MDARKGPFLAELRHEGSLPCGCAAAEIGEHQRDRNRHEHEHESLARTGLRSLLDGEPDLEVVGEARDGRQAVDAAATLNPDVVLMDIRMPVLDGIATARAGRSWQPREGVEAHDLRSRRVPVLCVGSPSGSERCWP